MPLFNKRESVGRAVRSVLAQSFADFELIVVDDGSQDGSSEVVHSNADPRIRVLEQPNLGVSVARNNGLLQARGEFVALLDADDEWAENFLEVMLDTLERNAGVQAVGACYRVQDEHGQRPGLRVPESELFSEGEDEIRLDFFRLSLAVNGLPLNSSSVVMRRSLLAKSGIYPPGITHGEDLDMWMRVGLACGDAGLVLTRRTYSVWHLDSENRACLRRSGIDRLPTTERVLSSRRRHDRTILEYAYWTLLAQADHLRMSGHRWASLSRLWQARRTRHYRGRIIRQLAKLLIDRRVLA